MIADRQDKAFANTQNDEVDLISHDRLDDELKKQLLENEDNVDNTETPQDTPSAITKTKPKDKALSFILAQVVICVIAVLIVLALKMVGGYYYDYSKAVFDECFNKPINKSQVLGENEARAVVAAQSTVYGMGGESSDNSIEHIDNKGSLSSSQQQAVKSLSSMANPVSSKTVTCEYGWRIHPITNKRSFHTGIDIGEDEGKDIYAVLDGVVKKTVEDDEDYGNYVIITHSNGVETMYAHCSKLTVTKGQSVAKGDVIALVGTTGLSTGPHLHFEVRINDVRLNPKWFLSI